jgi:hypothetical protein
MLTSWLPLAEVPAALGGLAVQPGGHPRGSGGAPSPGKNIDRPRPGSAAEAGPYVAGQSDGAFEHRRVHERLRQVPA